MPPLCVTSAYCSPAGEVHFSMSEAKPFAIPKSGIGSAPMSVGVTCPWKTMF